MIKQKKDILLKAYFISILLVIISIGICYKLFNLQLNPQERARFEAFAQKINFRESTIPAARGNLYAADGSLLATSVRKYDVAFDAKAMRQSLIDEHLNSLADSLHAMFNKPAATYAKLILNAKKNKKQYVPIAKNLNYHQLKRISSFPIFNHGQIKGGFIIEDHLVRERSVKDIGARTLGYVKGDSLKVGLEGAYNTLLSGKDGKRLEQRMGGGNWRPINIANDIQAVAGQDVVTTIDIPLQNVAYNALYDQLSEFEADHGTVVVMEVKTGEIKAIANLTRLADGNYADIQNFAVGEANEPGSTIKTISLLAALKDGVIDTATTVATGSGRVRLFGRTISDSHGYGTINVRQVLEKSSNIGTAKLITEYYQNQPEKFFRILNREWKLNQPLGVDIPGEAEPYLPNPNNKSWSKQSLSSISFGYESKLTPLQILTFYNGIANDGKMLKPLFVKEIHEKGKVIKSFSPEVRVEKMAQDSTIKKMQNMLASAVKSGTGRAFYNEIFPAAGKTGTARADYWVKGPMQYRASFCGYFPTYKPQYSCIVVIHKPSRKKGYYGSSVAGPVFQKIMESVYIKSPKKLSLKKSKLASLEKSNKIFDWNSKNKKMPNLKGFDGQNVIPVLENAGFKINYSGIGKIIEQSIPAGQMIPENKVITLKLSNV
ncbi:Penicillin-binding protein 2 [Candidatus Ornithobacterium hominis]|uniref:penicillin-binding protein n=1 Tax=Candidatus Ornithobacterium hominis TaxID=2497989 RepID=UPI0024BD3CD4|nr:penicillin-binding protein [Candidatus Ornithobacterium hominis]CAI9428865.1 Penicillin-binding protein 2 [Candidatus Ornithobacterium hominis]